MKIGILTYNRTHNYGAVLQCYALQQTLVSMGYEVSVINYKQPFIEKTNSFFSSKYFLEKIRHPKAGLMWFYKLYIKNIKYWYIKCNNYKNFRKKSTDKNLITVTVQLCKCFRKQNRFYLHRYLKKPLSKYSDQSE